MFKWKLVSVKKTRTKEIQSLEQDYLKRFTSPYSLDLVEAGLEVKAAHEEEIMKREGEGLLSHLSSNCALFALTERGDLLTSHDFASRLNHYEKLGRQITFIVGGAFGLHESLLQRAECQLALSPLTFPHEIARLVLIEQLYRAMTILRGSPPYHK